MAPDPRRGRYKNSSLSDEELIEVIYSDKYIVNPDNGSITYRNGSPLRIDRDSDGDRLFVTIYYKGKRKKVGIHRIIWLYVTKEPTPPKYEIHHRNEDKEDNRWSNLFCLHPLDHDKLHNGDLICNNSDPDQLPF